MKPVEFITELEKIKLWLEKESEKLPYKYGEYLGFFLGSDELKYNALRGGYWSSFFFARITDKINISLRIIPETELVDWPVYKSYQGIYSYTFCNKMSNFIAFNQIGLLLNKNLFSYVNNDWDTLMALALPLFRVFGTDDQLQYIKEYAFNPENQPTSNEEKDNVIKYLEFWNHYDKSEGHKILRETITGLNEDKKWLPDSIPAEDLGIWETRIKNLLMSRAKSNRVIYGNERVKEFILEGFLQPHGYDAEDLIFTHYPVSNMSKISINAVVDYFNLAKDTLPQEFVKSHFFQAALDIDKSFNAYRGEEHYKAALILESENKPLEAWNALVSASYWAGVNNSPENVEKHWQAAIKLCKKQNWTDAFEALTYQWEWYQEYKKTN
jgi:hypothetical protein